MTHEQRLATLRAAAETHGLSLTDELYQLILDKTPAGASEAELKKAVLGVVVWASMQMRSTIDREVIEAALMSDAELEAMERETGQSTPLHEAIAEGRRREIRRLLSAGADLRATAQRHDGQTPLLLALSQRDADTVALLLEQGADPSDDGEHSASPIHEACASAKCLRLILDAGADPNRTMEDGLTPLMLVADADRKLPRVELLLERGADPRPRNKHGESALDIAERAGASKIAELVRSHLTG